jgi:predicted O-methyltransferase YrrM
MSAPPFAETSPELWSAVDAYLNGLLIAPDAGLDGALAECEAAGLPPIDVAPNQGKLLHILARSIGAQRILEIGTLGGYSTIWLARALPKRGRLTTLEYDPRHAQVAAANIARAGLTEIVDIRVGAALDTLPLLAEDTDFRAFDLVFIDANKDDNPSYLEWALRLARRGALIIVDNVVRHGRILDPESMAPDVVGTRRMFEMIAAEPRLSATAFQTVGSKGLDGLMVALVV